MRDFICGDVTNHVITIFQACEFNTIEYKCACAGAPARTNLHRKDAQPYQWLPLHYLFEEVFKSYMTKDRAICTGTYHVNAYTHRYHTN